jgi:protein TonB
MALELLDNRKRAIGLGVAVAVNALLLALLLTLSPAFSPAPPGRPGLTTFDVAEPPPPPPPDTRPAGADAQPSRGATEAPSPPKPPRPLPSPTPAQPAVDAASSSASGAGAAAGSGAGQGGRGSGSGAGGSGTGAGAGATPPVHISGALTNADYARSGVAKGTTGTVFIAFRVRSDGRVDRCRVVRSSGNATIDRETCRLVERRFRFRPARDAAGRAIDFTLRTDFTWRPR